MPPQIAQNSVSNSHERQTQQIEAEVRIGRLRISRPEQSISGRWVTVENGESYYITGVQREGGGERYRPSAVRQANGQLRPHSNLAAQLPLPSDAELERDLVPLLGLQSSGHSGTLVARYSRDGIPGSYSLQEHFLIYLLDLQPGSSPGTFRRGGFHADPQRPGHRAEYRLRTASDGSGRPQVYFNGGRTADGHLLPPQSFNFCRWEQHSHSGQQSFRFARLPQTAIGSTQGPAQPRPQQPSSPSPSRPQTGNNAPQTTSPLPTTQSPQNSTQGVITQALQRLHEYVRRREPTGQLLAVHMTADTTRFIGHRPHEQRRSTSDIDQHLRGSLQRGPSGSTPSVFSGTGAPQAIEIPSANASEQRRYLAFQRLHPPEARDEIAIACISPDDARLPAVVRTMLRQQFQQPGSDWRELTLDENTARELGIRRDAGHAQPPRYRYAISTTGDISIAVYEADAEGRYDTHSRIFGCSIPRMFQFFSSANRSQLPLFVPARIVDGRYSEALIPL